MFDDFEADTFFTLGLLIGTVAKHEEDENYKEMIKKIKRIIWEFVKRHGS